MLKMNSKLTYLYKKSDAENTAFTTHSFNQKIDQLIMKD